MVERHVGPEFLGHDRDLGGVEIPAKRAAHEAAQQQAQGVQAPGLDHSPPPPRHRDGVEGEVDAAVGERPGNPHGSEAEQAVGARQPGVEGEGDPAARHGAPPVASGLRIGVA